MRGRDGSGPFLVTRALTGVAVGDRRQVIRGGEQGAGEDHRENREGGHLPVPVERRMRDVGDEGGERAGGRRGARRGALAGRRRRARRETSRAGRARRSRARPLSGAAASARPAPRRHTGGAGATRRPSRRRRRRAGAAGRTHAGRRASSRSGCSQTSSAASRRPPAAVPRPRAPRRRWRARARRTRRRARSAVHAAVTGRCPDGSGTSNRRPTSTAAAAMTTSATSTPAPCASRVDSDPLSPVTPPNGAEAAADTTTVTRATSAARICARSGSATTSVMRPAAQANSAPREKLR